MHRLVGLQIPHIVFPVIDQQARQLREGFPIFAQVAAVADADHQRGSGLDVLSAIHAGGDIRVDDLRVDAVVVHGPRRPMQVAGIEVQIEGESAGSHEQIASVEEFEFVRVKILVIDRSVDGRPLHAQIQVVFSGPPLANDAALFVQQGIKLSKMRRIGHPFATLPGHVIGKAPLHHAGHFGHGGRADDIR